MAIRLKLEDLPEEVPGTPEQLHEIVLLLIGDAQVSAEAAKELWVGVRFFSQNFLGELRRAANSPHLREELSAWERVEHMASGLLAAIKKLDKDLLEERATLLHIRSSLQNIIGIKQVVVEGKKKAILQKKACSGNAKNEKIAVCLLKNESGHGRHPLEVLSHYAKETRQLLASGPMSGPEHLYSRLKVDSRFWLAQSVTYWLRRTGWSPQDRKAATRVLDAMRLIFTYATKLDPDALPGPPSGPGRDSTNSADLERYRNAEMRACLQAEEEGYSPSEMDDERCEVEIEAVRQDALPKRSRNSPMKAPPIAIRGDAISSGSLGASQPSEDTPNVSHTITRRRRRSSAKR